jgi:ribokinase
MVANDMRTGARVAIRDIHAFVSAPITVAGSLNMDFVVQVQKLPQPGETVLGGGFVTIPGGKGANQRAAAAPESAERGLDQPAGENDAPGCPRINATRPGRP